MDELHLVDAAAGVQRLPDPGQVALPAGLEEEAGGAAGPLPHVVHRQQHPVRQQAQVVRLLRDVLAPGVVLRGRGGGGAGGEAGGGGEGGFGFGWKVDAERDEGKEEEHLEGEEVEDEEDEGVGEGGPEDALVAVDDEHGGDQQALTVCCRPDSVL